MNEGFGGLGKFSNGSFRKLGVPYFGILIIRILGSPFFFGPKFSNLELEIPGP